MKSLLASAIVLSTLIGPAAVADSEGRSAEVEPKTLETDRVATYTRSDVQTSTRSRDVSAKQHSTRSMKAGDRREVRSRTPSISAKGTYIYFRNVSTRLLTDRDGDAYFSEFRVRFDADSDIGDVLVYARLYLRRFGETDWLLYHTTDDFWLDGRSDSDDYYVTTTLDDGFATAEYDLLIDLYEVGYSGIVATIGPAHSDQLAYLPLEEVALDLPIELPGYAIGDIETTLLIDQDGDGHYSRFRIDFDPDAEFDGSIVYAKLWVRPQGGEWIEEHVSEDFLVDSSGTADVYSLTADWLSGYPTSYYDVQIDLYDSATGFLVAAAGSERPELAQIPLEDQTRDRRPNPPVVGGGGSASSQERGGGGAFDALWLVLLGTFLGATHIARRSQQEN